jgi:hypothetical protein
MQTNFYTADTLCVYYQAHVLKQQALLLSATLKSYEHVALDRTIDVENSIFEFFVPSAMEQIFLRVMERFEAEGIVSDVKKLPNRLADPTVVL